MRIRTVLLLAFILAIPVSANALTMSDPLTDWAKASAMDRMQLAARFGKSFVSLNESFTSGYFLKCIDDISTYGGAKDAKIEDALRECVASQQRLKANSFDDE